MSAIEEEIVARERLGPSKAPSRPKGKPPSTAATLVTKELPAAPSACYCNQLHRPTEFTVVTQVDEHKQLLRRAGWCYPCLRKGHLSRYCRTAGRCQSCHRRQHTSICSGLTSQEELNCEATTASPPTTESTTSNLSPSAGWISIRTL